VVASPFRWFGAQASYTYVESDADYANAVSGTSYGLEGLSKNSYSAVGFYEKYGLQARVAWTWRDKVPAVGERPKRPAAVLRIVWSARCEPLLRCHEELRSDADALNLTSAKEFTYSVTPNQVFSYGETGRRYALGVRARF